ncbi:MAG: PQQ-binding-like beta-propeller repeat protein [Planctomycetota bacterium]
MIRIGCLVTVIWLGWMTSDGQGDDWAQWRGPGRDGVWLESDIVTELPNGKLPRVWSTPIGSGYSGPTVANGRVYVSDRQVSTVDDQPLESERILCMDAKDGEILWKHSYEAPYDIGYRAGPRASITVADGRAYAVGAMGHFHCFDAVTGEVMWRHDLQRLYRVKMPIWGIAASPLVFDQLVIQIIGGTDGACVIAMNVETGEEVWRRLDERAGYSSPIMIQQAGQPIVVCWTGDSVSGLKARSGEIAWRVPFPPSRMPIGIATPVVDGDRLFVTSFYDGSMMIRVPPSELSAEMLWHRRGVDEKNTDALHSIIATPVMRDGYIYGVDSYGELRCLDADSGDRVWEDTTAVPRNRWATIHFVRHQSEDWMFNDQGQLTIARLTPQGYEPISQAHLVDTTTVQLARRNGVTWAHPAYADQHIFARNDEEIVCVSLARRSYE